MKITLTTEMASLATCIEFEAILAEIKGMEAENAHRVHCGSGMAYGDAAFSHKAEELEYLRRTLTGENQYACPKCGGKGCEACWQTGALGARRASKEKAATPTARP